MCESSDALDQARQEAGLSHGDLWLRYFGLGGMRTPLELEAYVFGALVPTPHDGELIAVALNERFSELGRDPRVPYADDDDN